MPLQLYIIVILLSTYVYTAKVSPSTAINFVEYLKNQNEISCEVCENDVPVNPPARTENDDTIYTILSVLAGLLFSVLLSVSIWFFVPWFASYCRDLDIRNSYKENSVMGEWHEAAKSCIDKNVSNGSRLGLGSGSVVECVIHVLEASYRSGELRDIMIVPSCHATRLLLRDAGLPYSCLESTSQLDVYIDGPEEIDGNLIYMKDIHNGDSLVFHRVLQYASKKTCIIGDSERMSSSLGEKYGHVPIEVDPGVAKFLVREIPLKEGGTASTRVEKDDIDGYRMLTDNGHNIIDWVFDKMTEHDWPATHLRLRGMPGVIDTGIFFNVADKAYIAFPDGAVEEREGMKA